ncbi:unnamed protein product, partial [Mesorhabditis belari]|uniref:YEATS domain-containing protein n=1 Tax=Mesorhabditis belari TaxID=2138241 RepID=A0AAF3EFP2_9BILA
MGAKRLTIHFWQPMANEGNERIRGKSIVKPVVYGNTAEAFGYKRESDGHTHKWTVFVRPYLNEDGSRWIRKVQFKLHESYANSTRVIEQPPFEVTETGWGEFEVQMRIYFADQNEKPVTAFHYLRLFQPVFNVFQDPTTMMYKILTTGDAKKHDPRMFYHDLIARRKKTVDTVAMAKQEISKEIEDLRESLREAHRLIIKYRNEAESGESGPATPNVSFSVG